MDVRTGAIRLAGLFPNPGNSSAARPVRQGAHRHQSGARARCWCRSARSSELQGSYQIAVVDSDNKVTIRPVKLGDTVGARLDHQRRREAGRARDRRRRAEGSAGDAGQSEAVPTAR